jgi:hypothetical protein
MKAAQFRMEPLANHVAITHDDSTNERIRTNPPTPMLRQLKSSPQMTLIRSSKLRIHH